MWGDFHRARDRRQDHGFALVSKEGARDVWKHRGHATLLRNVSHSADATVLTRSDDDRASTKCEIKSGRQWPSRFHDEVPSRDASVRRAVGDELGNVLRANKDGLERPTERRRQRPFTGCADGKSGVREQFAALLV